MQEREPYFYGGLSAWKRIFAWFSYRTVCEGKNDNFEVLAAALNCWNNKIEIEKESAAKKPKDALNRL